VGAKRDKVDVRTSESLRIKLGAILLGALCILVLVLLEHPTGTYEFAGRLFRLVIEGIFVAAIGLFLTETRTFKNHMEERLARFGIVERATDREVLGRFNRETLLRIERAAQLASMPTPLPAELEELVKALNVMRDPSLVWRTNYRYVLHYKPSMLPKHYQLYTDLTFEYVNYNETDQIISQMFRMSGCATPNSGEQISYKVHRLEIGGQDILPKLTPEAKTEGIRRSWTSNIDVLIPPERSGRPRVRVRYECTDVFPDHNPWMLTMYRPVHELELILQHPENVIPQVHVFGVGGSAETDPLAPEISRPDFHRWKYDGWLLRQQGLILTFHRD
jgi:hypothetical protein